jgi:hypothetical protein
MSDDTKRYAGPNVDGPSSLSPYPISRMSAPHDLVDTAREIQKADGVITAVASEKLGMIAEQIRALQAQARDVLARAQRDAELHRAECRFQKVSGQVYHLYRRTRDGSDAPYFSMLSPADWRGKAPDRFEGSYRLENDASFTPLDEIAARDGRALSSRKLLLG